MASSKPRNRVYGRSRKLKGGKRGPARYYGDFRDYAKPRSQTSRRAPRNYRHGQRPSWTSGPRTPQ